MKPITLNFLFGGNASTSLTTNIVSDSLKIEQSYIWNVTPTVTSLTGSPTYTIEVSNNDNDWFEYDALFTDLAITKAMEVDGLSFLYVRVAITSNGATGTAEFASTLKSR